MGNLHAVELLLNVLDNPADPFAVDLQVILYHMTSTGIKAVASPPPS